MSEENYKTLLAELKSFPYNIDGRMYTSMLDKNVIFQGDGLKKKKMPIIDLVNIERGVKKCKLFDFIKTLVIWIYLILVCFLLQSCMLLL